VLRIGPDFDADEFVEGKFRDAFHKRD